jgi:aspartate oxidase
MSNTIEIYIQKVAKMKTDILIVGSGCSGLYCALNLPREKQITIITKSDVKSSDSYLAQGGICMLKDDSDYDSYFEDTMKAGHYENDRESVSIMIRSSQDVIHDLIGFGVDFAHDENGNLAFTREGAHSDKRILFHEDITGKEITPINPDSFPIIFDIVSELNTERSIPIKTIIPKNCGIMFSNDFNPFFKA